LRGTNQKVSGKFNLEILLPGTLVKVKLNSDELFIQDAREKEVLSVVYMSPLDIPESPAEPDPEPYRPIVQPLVWPFNGRTPASFAAPVSVPNAAFMPLLSAMLGGQSNPVASVGQLKLSSILANVGKTQAQQPTPNWQPFNQLNQQQYQTFTDTSFNRSARPGTNNYMNRKSR
jgi:hypothetical protein